MTDFYLLGYDPGTPQYTFPRRGGAALSGTCIIHTAECARDDVGEDSSAEATAKFIAERTDYGSYHTLVDSDSIIEMVPYEYEAWQDSETNNWAVGISAACRTTDWRNMPAEREEGYYRNLAWAAADFVRYMSTKGIEVPRTRISGAEARARKPGFCAHGDSGVSRSDPGINFDWGRFFNYIDEVLEGKTQEEELSADSQFISKDGYTVTLNDLLNSIDGKVEPIRALDIDLRGDLEAKGKQINNLIAQVNALLSAQEALINLVASKNGLSVEEVRQALSDALKDGIKITLGGGEASA